MIEIGPNLLKVLEGLEAVTILSIFAFLMYKVLTRY